MKIKNIMLKNFATVNEIQIDFKDGVTYLVGENGSGKTTCGLNAIWFVLEGIAKTGKKVLHADRFRFIGKYGKSAIGQITLYDEKEDIEIYLQRKMTKGATTLKVAASDGRDLGENFVDKIFNIFSINPEGFAMLSPKDQAIALGVDTSSIDARKNVAYNQRRELGYDVKRARGALEEFGEIEEIKSVDIQKLLDKKTQIDKDNAKLVDLAQIHRDRLCHEAITHNKMQDDLQYKKKTLENNITILKDKIESLNKEIKVATDKLEFSKSKLANLPPVEDQWNTNIPMPEIKRIDTSEIEEAISKAQEQNKKAFAWEEYEKLKEKYRNSVERYNKKDQEYQNLERERVEYLRSCNLPFSNIAINESGELEIDGRPFNKIYFSKGEILRAGVKMAAATNPKLKYIFVPDAQSIDEKNRETLFTELIDAGFQVVAEMVGTKKKEGDNSILLRESRVVDNYEDTKNVL